MNQEKVGKLICQLRKKQCLTQNELGEMIQVTGKAVSRWEQGKNLPDITSLGELAKIFGITVDELLSGDLKEDVKPVKNYNKLFLIIFILLILIFAFIIYGVFRNSNSTKVYSLQSNDQHFSLSGRLIVGTEQVLVEITNISYNRGADIDVDSICSIEALLLQDSNLIIKVGSAGMNYDGSDKRINFDEYLDDFTMKISTDEKESIDIEKAKEEGLSLQFIYILPSEEHKSYVLNVGVIEQPL